MHYLFICIIKCRNSQYIVEIAFNQVFNFKVYMDDILVTSSDQMRIAHVGYLLHTQIFPRI